MCACGCDTTRNITKRQLNLLRQQTLFFAYPMAGLMTKLIGCGMKPVRQLAVPNAELCGVRSTSERALGYASAPNTEK